MKNLIKFSIISFIVLFLLEITAPVFIKLGYLDKGLPPWVTLYADKETSYWHPKNVTFEIEKKNCWQSKVTYNNLGMRQVKDISKKNKKRIALLGDSMVENIELSDGYDLSSRIQKKLQNYEVMNFSVRGTGLSDQLDVYNKYIKNNEIDVLILFITENDFINNYHLHSKNHSKSFKFINNKVMEIERDKKFFEKYDSNFYKLRREISKNFKGLNLYKLYLKTLHVLKTKNQNTNYKIDKKIIHNKYEVDFEKKIRIYDHIKKEFLNNLQNNIKLYVILNLRPYTFEKDNLLNNQELFIKKKVIPYLLNTWKDYKEFNPYKNAKNFMINRDIFAYPYLSMNCDAHYSEIGAEFYAEYVEGIIKQ